MDTRLNIFTKTEQVEFIPISPCHSQFIKYRHYCHSLARANDMKIIIVQECHGLSWDLQNILFNRRRQGKMGSLLVQQACILELLSIFIMVFSSRPPKERKRNKTIYTGKLPTSKRRTRNLFGFSF